MNRFIITIFVCLMFESCDTNRTGSDSDTDSDVDSDSDSDADSDADSDSDSDSDMDSDVDSDSDGFWCQNPKVLFSENFDHFTVEQLLVETAGDPWMTWSKPVDPAEDALIAETESHSKPISVYVKDGNNVILDLEKTNGIILIEWWMLVEEGKTAGYSLMQLFDNTKKDASVLGCEVFFLGQGQGNCIVEGKSIHFKYSKKEEVWLHIQHIIDIDNDVSYFFIDDFEASLPWKWSVPSGGGGFQKVDGINFFGQDTPQTGTSYWIDDISIITCEKLEFPA